MGAAASQEPGGAEAALKCPGFTKQVWQVPQVVAPVLALDARLQAGTVVRNCGSGKKELGACPTTCDADGYVVWDLDSSYMLLPKDEECTWKVGQCYTHCAWVKWRVSNSPRRTLFGTEDGQSSISTGNGTTKLGMSMKDGFRGISFNIEPETWQFVCVVGKLSKEEGGSNGLSKFYVGSLTDPPALVGQHSRAIVGAELYAIGYDDERRKGVGKLASCAVWNMALSPKQIGKLYSASRPMTIEAMQAELHPEAAAKTGAACRPESDSVDGGQTDSRAPELSRENSRAFSEAEQGSEIDQRVRPPQDVSNAPEPRHPFSAAPPAAPGRGSQGSPQSLRGRKTGFYGSGYSSPGGFFASRGSKSPPVPDQLPPAWAASGPQQQQQSRHQRQGSGGSGHRAVAASDVDGRAAAPVPQRADVEHGLPSELAQPLLQKPLSEEGGGADTEALRSSRSPTQSALLVGGGPNGAFKLLAWGFLMVGLCALCWFGGAAHAETRIAARQAPLATTAAPVDDRGDVSSAPWEDAGKGDEQDEEVASEPAGTPAPAAPVVQEVAVERVSVGTLPVVLVVVGMLFIGLALEYCSVF